MSSKNHHFNLPHAAALTARLSTRRLPTKVTLLLPASTQLPTQRVRRRQRATDSAKITLLHVTLKILLDTTTSRIVRKAHQRPVLIRVQPARVRQLANTALVIRQILLEQRLALRLAERRGDAAAVLALGAVVAVADGLVAVDGVVVGGEALFGLDEGQGAELMGAAPPEPEDEPPPLDDEPATQHWMEEEPGHAPAMKEPLQLELVDLQVPEPEEVLQDWVTQH